MGCVYILTNKAMPGIIKIGFTGGSVEDRMKELDTTGVPLPFKCHYAVETDKYKEIERLMHDAFDDHRIRSNREFFEIDAERAVAILKIVEIKGGKEITSIENTTIDYEGVTNSEPVREKKGSGLFPFSSFGIPVGAELSFTRDESKKCSVVSDGRVKYDEKVYSLSGLAAKLMQELGYKGTAYQGPIYFEYKGKILDRIRTDFLNELAAHEDDYNTDSSVDSNIDDNAGNNGSAAE